MKLSYKPQSSELKYFTINKYVDMIIQISSWLLASIFCTCKKIHKSHANANSFASKNKCRKARFSDYIWNTRKHRSQYQQAEGANKKYVHIIAAKKNSLINTLKGFDSQKLISLVCILMAENLFQLVAENLFQFTLPEAL